MLELVFTPPPDFIPSPQKSASEITDADVEAVFPDVGLRREFCNKFRRDLLRRRLAATHAPATPTPTHQHTADAAGVLKGRDGYVT
jgi:hypothetical protein